MKFKPGDEVIVIKCNRIKSELGWVGIVVYDKGDRVWVDIKSSNKFNMAISYEPDNIRKLTKLDKALK